MDKRKRISVSLPVQLITRLAAYGYVSSQERGKLVEALLEEYLADLDEDTADKMLQKERRDIVSSWVEKLRNSGKKAADIILP